MRKKLLAVLMTGAMVASFAGSATVVSAKSDDDNKLTVWAWDQNFNIKSSRQSEEILPHILPALRKYRQSAVLVLQMPCRISMRRPWPSVQEE